MQLTNQFQKVKASHHSPGPLIPTHIVHHIFQIARPTNFKLGIWIEDDDHSRNDLQGQGHKIRYPMTRGALRTSFKVNRSKIRVTDQLMQTPKMCHIFWTVRPKNFKVGVQMEDVDPHQRQAPW